MQGRLYWFWHLLFLFGVIFLSGCLSTSSEPDIVATRIIESNTSTPSLDSNNATVQTTAEPSESSIATTEEPAETTPTVRDLPEQFDIVGIIRNATTNTIVEEPLEINAIFVTQDGLETIELYNESKLSNPDGTFRFENITTNDGLVNLRVEYAGIRQFSKLYLLPAELTDDGILNVDFFVYEVTGDRSTLSFNYVETFFDASPSENAATILQTVELINNGNRIVYDGEYSFSIPLPDNALNPRIQVPPIIGLRPEDLGTIEETAEGFVVQGLVPLLPGPTGRLFFQIIYDLPYNESVSVTQRFEYPVSRMVLWVPVERQLSVQSEQLPREADQSREDINYIGYTVIDPIESGETLTYRVSGGVVLESDITSPAPASTPTTVASSNENSASSDFGIVVVGIGVLLIVAGILYLFYDLQKTRLKMQAQHIESIKSQKDIILEKIAELDAAFERGEIDEEQYQSERQSLKEQLRKFFV